MINEYSNTSEAEASALLPAGLPAREHEYLECELCPETDHKFRTVEKRCECPACGYGIDELQQVKVSGCVHQVHKNVSAWMQNHVAIRVRTQAELKHGVSRWIYDNWHKLGALECDCGKRVDYGIVRATGELKCRECASGQTCG